MVLKKKQIVVLFAALWVTAVAAGMSVVISHSNTAGVSGQSPSDWPLDCPIPRTVGRNTLLMFVHPRCPCSRASLRELARMLAQTGDRLDACVVLYQPVDEPNAWSCSDLRQFAMNIPGVKIFSDIGSAMALQFGVRTSGHVLLYNAQGRQLFSGGITASRGHEGDNLGRSAVVSLVQGSRQSPHTCPVFGCPILKLK